MKKHVLAKAIETYLRELPRLLREHRGKWVAIHDEEILGEGFETREQALWKGYATYPPTGEVSFLVRQVVQERGPLTSLVYRPAR